MGLGLHFHPSFGPRSLQWTWIPVDRVPGRSFVLGRTAVTLLVGVAVDLFVVVVAGPIVLARSILVFGFSLAGFLRIAHGLTVRVACSGAARWDVGHARLSLHQNPCLFGGIAGLWSFGCVPELVHVARGLFCDGNFGIGSGRYDVDHGPET